jgi:hypothetical protein
MLSSFKEREREKKQQQQNYRQIERESKKKIIILQTKQAPNLRKNLYFI